MASAGDLLLQSLVNAPLASNDWPPPIVTGRPSLPVKFSDQLLDEPVGRLPEEVSDRVVVRLVPLSVTRVSWVVVVVVVLVVVTSVGVWAQVVVVTFVSVMTFLM